jgi:Phage ABA sandwich domain
MISRKEIMQLNVGRETDILVAEQVMGWEIETDAVKLKRLNRYISNKAENCWWRTPEGGWRSDPPSYSSEIAAAWQVVERMKNKGRFIFLIQRFNENKVAFDDPSASNPDYITAKSLTGAICKAALMVSI